jgi:FKBP-type peptidyl-prolyl cis-trans isomerase SlyD
MVQIAKDTVVNFHYALTDVEGSFTESSAGDEPAAYLHGYGNIISGLENEMDGRSIGDEFSVTIQPIDGYGVLQENAVQRVSIKHLANKGPLKKGMVVGINTSEGVRQARVVKAGRFNVDVDTNHPLAGRVLKFDVSIVSVRKATDEELEHGHAHGPGGHKH